MKTIAFTKVRLPYGWMGNMAPFPVSYDDKTFRTTEALFQALRFDDTAIHEIIRAEKSAMAAKMQAKNRQDKMVIVPQSTADVDNMRMVLRLKLSTHPALREELLATGDAVIVEDCTRRPHGSGLFWGAALIDNAWTGENVLGTLWMELRDATKEAA